MHGRKKKITLAAFVGDLILVIILVLGTVWMGRSAKSNTEAAVRSVSLLYLDELAGRREQVVAENMREKIGVIETALDLMTEEDLSDNAHLEAYQAKIKRLFHLERFAFVGSDDLIYTSTGPRAEISSWPDQLCLSTVTTGAAAMTSEPPSTLRRPETNRHQAHADPEATSTRTTPPETTSCG